MLLLNDFTLGLSSLLSYVTFAVCHHNIMDLINFFLLDLFEQSSSRERQKGMERGRDGQMARAGPD